MLATSKAMRTFADPSKVSKATVLVLDLVSLAVSKSMQRSVDPSKVSEVMLKALALVLVVFAHYEAMRKRSYLLRWPVQKPCGFS